MKPGLRTFDQLVGEGLKPIALAAGTKRPIHKKWNENWSEDLHRSLIKNTDANIGILLGKMIDVEGDSETANARIDKLVRGHDHPVYRSSKSFHHLFRNPDPDLTVLKYKDVEFRGNNHQSVIPPSIVGTTQYKWIVPLAFPLPEMPPELLKFYQELKQFRKRHATEIKKGHMHVACSKCREKKFVHKERFRKELFALREMNSPWVCQDCRTVDLRSRCKEIGTILKRVNITDWRDWIRYNENLSDRGDRIRRMESVPET